jgi:RND family efflux transporter MFP subunit
MKLPRSKPLRLLFLIAGSLLIYFLFARQSAVSAPSKKETAPHVSLTRAQIKSLPLTLTTQGHAVSLNQVDIQSQLTGTVKAVAFKEGDFVSQGQLLFTLDDSTQQANLHHALASEAESVSLLNKAQHDLTRGRALKAQNYISASDWDTLTSAQQQYTAQYHAAQDDIKSAQTQLSYTQIYAPVSGKTGALNVHPGSLVQPGSSVPLVTVSQFDPIGVSFTLPEKDLNAVIVAQLQGPVRVRVNNAKGQAVTGTLDFINNTVSTDSGTIALKARFTNGDHLLWPGAYQAVTVDAGVTPDAVVLPPQAVQNGPDGHFIYLINQQQQVEVKAVNLLRIQQQMAVVEGVSQGTPVVVEGANDLRPGIKVVVSGNVDMVNAGQNE